MSDEKDSVEKDDISKNDDVTLTDVDKEFQEIVQLNRKEKYGLESDKSETDEREKIEIPELLKMIDSQKNRI